MKVGVVGAGVVGVACARALQMAGHAIVLFDPAPPGSTCSFGNAGHIALDHIRPLARPDVLAGVPRMLTAPLGPLALRWRGVPALSPWLARFVHAARPPPDWLAMLGSAGMGDMLRRQGALAVMETAAGLAAARTEGQVQAAHGVAFQDLDGDAVLAMVPGLVGRPAGGRLYPEAAHAVNPFRLVQDLAARVVADGGTLVAEPVASFVREGRAVRGVRLGGGDVALDQVVLTAGVASPALAGPLGVHLPMTAERGYHAMLPRDALDVALPITFNERGFVVTPMEHGIRLAGTVELGAGRRAPDWARADILAEHTRRLFGRAVAMTGRWQGDRPTLPDYLPAIGRVAGMDGLVVAAGHQHLGLTLAAVTARLVTGLIDGGPMQDIGAFDPCRFSSMGFRRSA
jgi:D-amino-acid dehydrogenase